MVLKTRPFLHEPAPVCNSECSIFESRKLLTKSRLIEYLRVDDIVGPFAACGLEHTFGHRRSGRSPDVRGRCRPVRRQDHVVQTDQGIARRQRLDLEDIEAGAGDPAMRRAATSAC